MINFKKNGRPTKVEKSLLKSINNFLSSLTDEEKSRYDFDGEYVTEGSRLNDIWNSLNVESVENVAPKHEEEVNEKPKEIVEEKIEEPDIFKKDFESFSGEKAEGSQNNIEEIKEEIEEESNFVNNQEEMKTEDAEILSEVSDNSTENEVPSFFNPLAAPVKQRSYNKAANIDVGDISEPDFGKAPSPKEEIEEAEKESQRIEEEVIRETEAKREKPIDRITNEAVNDLSEKDRKLASKQLVETVLGAYEMLHEVAKKAVVYPEEKLQEKIMSGEIDPDMEVDMGGGITTNIVEFIKEFNESAEEAISYDPEFGEKVRPAMERVFAKRGWGVSDEQFLAIEFLKDAGFKGMQIMNLRKTSRHMVDTFAALKQQEIQQREEEARMKYEYEKRNKPVEPTSIVTPPQQEEPSPEPMATHEEVEYEQETHDPNAGGDLIIHEEE